MPRESRGRSLPVARALVAAAVLFVALIGATTGSASAATSRDGWGFGIADNSTPQVMGLHFRHLEPKSYRFQMPWNAIDFPSEITRARGLIERARRLGVQQIVVSLDDGKDVSGSPSPAAWRAKVDPLVDALAGDVNVWGPANEPNAGRGWLRVTSASDFDGPTKAAGYYRALQAKLASLGWPAALLSPEFHDHTDESGEPIQVRLDSGGTGSTVRRYIERYVAAGGGFGHYAGWHPYTGVRRMNIASTNDFAAALPSGSHIWVTEIGSIISAPGIGISQTELQQLNQVNWITGTLANHPRVARLNYYHIQESPNWDSGLTRADGSIRPAWHSWCAAAHGDNLNARACDLGARVVSTYRDGVTYLATRGPDGAVWMSTHTALTGWSVWYSLGGDIAGDPALFSWGGGHVGVLARRASDGALIQRFYGSGSWNPGWERIGDWQLASDPAPISWKNGHVDVFARGTGGNLIHTYFADSRWHGFEDLGGQILGTPAPMSWQDGHTDVYVRGIDGSIHHRYFAGGTWHPFESLGGSAAGDPAAITWGPGHNDVFMRGTDGGLYHRFFGSSGWSPTWERIGGSGTITSDPTVLVTGPGNADVHARGSNGTHVHTWFGSSGWEPFEQLGDRQISGRPSGVVRGGTSEEVFTRGVDSRVLNRWFPAPVAWSPWNVLGAPGAD